MTPLSAKEVRAIKYTIKKYDPNVNIIIFGSRADITKKGGDIDITVKYKDINLDTLPEEGKKELLGYYQLLIEKYNKKQKLKNLLVNPKGKITKNFKFNRDEIY